MQEYINLWDITFCKVDEDGNYISRDGEPIIYQLKSDVRYKPLEYICEGIEVDMIEEVKK
jgi:hypothetical protein